MFRKELLAKLKEINIKGYIYSMWSGKLVVHEGYVLPSKNGRPGRFYRYRGDKLLGSIMCDNEPGVIVNSAVWFEERDDKKAIDMLIQYELDQIESCEVRIENHKAKIQMLKKAVL